MNFKFVATILTEEEQKLLKKKAKANSKDALRIAVLHYISCDSEPVKK